ncbi:hypothetical protein P175DRAFT_067321 [Aspergillus ochraceoroseus IBT 24754]|uniref:Uncharacterized protein n=1 Tax=Aspergillus ochraceoroseus IBT 24754 TaxID=1392256 RepID=A0A2T5M9K8_9EURO|nr:uncharacterized protein P175DRAFT_067321 [Aspergillus ochraceoroseus IBT 24754]PTU25223.1 hypothetical protein P175DRAFT_067321 [Aspergillus ochraceoroseus IBT 24754]
MIGCSCIVMPHYLVMVGPTCDTIRYRFQYQNDIQKVYWYFNWFPVISICFGTVLHTYRISFICSSVPVGTEYYWKRL